MFKIHLPIHLFIYYYLFWRTRTVRFAWEGEFATWMLDLNKHRLFRIGSRGFIDGLIPNDGLSLSFEQPKYLISTCRISIPLGPYS